MTTYALDHLSDGALLHQLASLAGRDRATTAALLAHLGETESRRLYASAGYPSMFAYCVGELRMSEDAAIVRIRVARVARKFPIVFERLADGRLHLTAVHMLRQKLTRKNACELLAAAENKSKSEIEQMLAEMFPLLDVPTSEQAIGSASPSDDSLVLEPPKLDVAEPQNSAAPRAQEPSERRSSAAPLSPERFALQATISKATHEKLRHAQELLSHALPSGDIALVLDRALDALIRELEKRKFGATSRPRSAALGTQTRPAAGNRYVPNHVKSAVWQRDGGRCTFVNETGHRCAARSLLEFDHVEPVARGGEATIDNVRLRCRAHNQLEAERVFGSKFMDHKRRAAQDAARSRETPAADPAVIAALRSLGYRADEARRVAVREEVLAPASLEDRVRTALACLYPRGVRREQFSAGPNDATASPQAVA